MKLIRLKDVNLWYGKRRALKQISFEVAFGETVAIMGASGSGKSSLLKVIMGLVRPNSGSVLIEGEDIIRLNSKELLRIQRRMGMVFQEGALFDSITVGENVGFALWEHSRLGPSEIESEVRRLLTLMNLEAEVARLLPEQLSGGMKMRVSIARALAARPQVMLYDEPTAGLDPIACSAICDLIHKLQDSEQVTSLLVTHHLDTAFRVGDRFLMLYEGELIFDGTFRELISSKDSYIQSFLSQGLYQGQGGNNNETSTHSNNLVGTASRNIGDLLTSSHSLVGAVCRREKRGDLHQENFLSDVSSRS